MEGMASRLLRRVQAGPDPEAEVRLARFLEAAGATPGGAAACVPDDDAEQLLALILGHSPALSRELFRAPAELAAVSGSPYLRREKPARALRAELSAALAVEPGTAADVARTLRRLCAREYLRLGGRELGFGRPEEVGRELAALASECLAAAVTTTQAELCASIGAPLTETGAPCRFVVMGMGKLGGAELNFSSDIDLIYLYQTDAGAAGRLSLHEFFTRLCERTTALIAEPTTEGACFRVDLRLRPEGSRGPLCNSLDAAERYYETWGRPWERQAWIKARPVAGDVGFGEEVLARLAPLLWPRAGVASAIDEVQTLLGRVRAELRDPQDVKLGRGGIREVEFFVQALQRLHGGRRPELRQRGTLAALDRLLVAGLVSEREHRLLGDAYVFLRRVEHRLQLAELRQTHALPTVDSERALLARRLGFADEPALSSALASQLSAVAAIFATLGQPGAAADGSPEMAAALALLDPLTERAASESALSALGFRNLAAAADELELLRGKPHSPLSPTATGAAARAAPRLLLEVAASPDPDLALRRLVDLAARGAPARTVWQLIGESEAISRLLVNLFGTSEFLSRILIARPELSERLLTAAADPLPLLPDAAHHCRAIAALIGDGSGSGDAALEEDRLEELRRYRNQEILRLGLGDVGGELDVDELGAALTALAEACIDSALAIVRPGVEARWGRARTPLAVLGLGKLGGGEMTWSSDLDLLFVFGDDEAGVDAGESGRADVGAFEVMSRLAQRLLYALSAQLPSGRLYEVDTRLRPSGRQGALVSSLLGFQRYHQEQARLWERQALLKLRTVAGDGALGARVEDLAARHLWAPHPEPGWAERAGQEIAHLRGRMERELSGRRGRYDVKLGRGGLVDVEFLTQYLQLVHGPERPALRVRATGAALEALADTGILPPGQAAELADSYRFLRRLENRLRIVEDRATAELGGEGHGLDQLARRLGYHDAHPGSRLLEEYRLRSSRIRTLCARFLPLEVEAAEASPGDA